MKRTFLATAVALPCLIALGLNCSDDTGFKGPQQGTGGGSSTTTNPTTSGGGTNSTTTNPTTSTTGGGNGGDQTTSGGGNGGDQTTTGGGNGGGGAGGAPGGAAGRGGGGMGGGVGGVGGTGGMGGGTGMPCTAQGDCTGVLRTRAGQPMDGWANIDPPRQVQPPDGIQGNSEVDNAAPAAGDQMCGSPCAGTETRTDHGLPLKWASWNLAVDPTKGITMGTTYKVTIHFYGVVECKTYPTGSCTRAANTGRDAKYDLWCPNVSDPANTADHYNTYMLSVTPMRSGTTPNLGPNQGPVPAMGSYWMLNECPTGESESHKTWMIDYEKTINVPAGSWVNFLDFDTNCREILNCGNSQDAQQACTTHYMLSPGATVPAPPAGIQTQPASAGAGGFGQWIFFDVKSIVPM
jgi:hypothetical protein